MFFTLVGCGNQYVGVDDEHYFSVGTKRKTIRSGRASSELCTEAIMFFEEAISDIRPGLLNVERLALGIINAPDERLHRLPVVRELSQLANQLGDGNSPLRGAFF